MKTSNLDAPYTLIPTHGHTFQKNSIRAKCYAIIVKWSKGHKKGITLRYYRRHAYQQEIGNLSAMAAWNAMRDMGIIARTAQLARLKSEGQLRIILPIPKPLHIKTGEPMLRCPLHGATEWTFHPSKEKNPQFIGYCNRCNAETKP